MQSTPENRPVYRLLTGRDDRAFCERVSEAIAQGWRLHGSPTMCWEPVEGHMKVGQALIWADPDLPAMPAPLTEG